MSKTTYPYFCFDGNGGFEAFATENEARSSALAWLAEEAG